MGPRLILCYAEQIVLLVKYRVRSGSSQRSRLVSIYFTMLARSKKVPALDISMFLRRCLSFVQRTRNNELAKTKLLRINSGLTSTSGPVLSVKRDLAKIQLISPACTRLGSRSRF
jgi:hypothetical protein